MGLCRALAGRRPCSGPRDTTTHPAAHTVSTFTAWVAGRTGKDLRPPTRLPLGHGQLPGASPCPPGRARVGPGRGQDGNRGVGCGRVVRTAFPPGQSRAADCRGRGLKRPGSGQEIPGSRMPRGWCWEVLGSELAHCLGPGDSLHREVGRAGGGPGGALLAMSDCGTAHGKDVQGPVKQHFTMDMRGLDVTRSPDASQEFWRQMSAPHDSPGLPTRSSYHSLPHSQASRTHHRVPRLILPPASQDPCSWPPDSPSLPPSPGSW